MDTSTISTKKFPYFFIILCLIPGIGLFVGGTLILIGLFYKDNRFVKVGFIGFLSTLIVFIFISYDTKYGKQSHRAYVKMDQENLNNIALQLEYYKLANETYPDSLTELTRNNKYLIINDPILVINREKPNNSLYQYRKIGDQYTLFSVGMDLVPNTQDDIYPIVFDSGKIKYGLIKR